MATTDEKQRRMQIRRDLGLRNEPKGKVVHSPFGVDYPIAHACFVCRKSFKSDPALEADHRVCPQCGGRLHEMGRSFNAPSRSDLEQWKKVQTLYALGFRFFSYRSHNCPPFPDRLRDVAAFNKEHPDHPWRLADLNEELLP